MPQCLKGDHQKRLISVSAKFQLTVLLDINLFNNNASCYIPFLNTIEKNPKPVAVPHPIHPFSLTLDVKNVTILVYRRPGCSFIVISRLDSSSVSHCVQVLQCLPPLHSLILVVFQFNKIVRQFSLCQEFLHMQLVSCSTGYSGQPLVSLFIVCLAFLRKGLLFENRV